jgi:hypothetical protein
MAPEPVVPEPVATEPRSLVPSLVLVAVDEVSAGADPREVARTLLRGLAARALACAPTAIHVTHDAAGRPRLTGPSGVDALRCTASHAGSLAAAAVARGCLVGIDIEPVDPSRADLPTVARFLHARSAAALGALDAMRRPAAVALAWTQLEAEAKGRGRALDQLRGRPRTGVSSDLVAGRRHVGSLWTDRPATVRQVVAPDEVHDVGADQPAVTARTRVWASSSSWARWASPRNDSA